MDDDLTNEVAESFKGFVWANNITPSVGLAMIRAVVDRMRSNNVRDDEIRSALIGAVRVRAR